MNKLSWIEFDECINSIYKQCKNNKFEGVYGFPRGGLCLAFTDILPEYLLTCNMCVASAAVRMLCPPTPHRPKTSSVMRDKEASS